MNDNDVPVGPLVARIVSVLAATLLLALVAVVLLGVTGGDPAVRSALIHIIETLVGVFVGIAAGRLAQGEGGSKS